MTKEEWGKLLYLYAVKIAQANTAEDLERETRAGEAIVKLAKAAGYDPKTITPELPESDSSKRSITSARSSTERIARAGMSELRADQLSIIDDES